MGGCFQGLALDALTALATAESAGDAIDALQEARRALGDEAPGYEPLLMSLTARASEVFRLRRMAGRDPLTGVANRRAFEEALQREIARHERNGSGLAIVLLDLDGLKELNDQFGHAAGDQAIVAVARVCLSALRTTDLVARLGGDEFAILLPGVDREGANAVAQRLRMTVEGTIVAGARLALSLGTAAANEPTVLSVELLAEADGMLYADKRARKSSRRAA